MSRLGAPTPASEQIEKGRVRLTLVRRRLERCEQLAEVGEPSRRERRESAP